MIYTTFKIKGTYLIELKMQFRIQFIFWNQKFLHQLKDNSFAQKQDTISIVAETRHAPHKQRYMFKCQEALCCELRHHDTLAGTEFTPSCAEIEVDQLNPSRMLRISGIRKRCQHCSWRRDIQNLISQRSVDVALLENRLVSGFCRRHLQKN